VAAALSELMLLEFWHSLAEDERREFLGGLSVDEVVQLTDQLQRDWESPPWRPLSHQVPPSGDWYGWVLLAGRGSGKTDACAAYITEHVNGPPCMPGPVPHWIGIIAPTLGDAATACFAGPSGLRAHNPDAKLVQKAGGLAVTWPNGSEAKLFGAHTPDDVERLRAGGNRCACWLEELAAWRYLDQCWEHMRFGLRVGERPHWIASTTPKARPLIKRLADGKVPRVVVTRAGTSDNPHLAKDIRDALYEEYGGQAIGRQELHGDILDEDQGALWRRSWIEEHRLVEVPRQLQRLTVGVDPSGGAGEQGIVVVGRSDLDVIANGKARKVPEGFVLDDRTCCLSPDGWGRRAVTAAVDWEADDICVETNYGGDMAVATIRGAAEDMGVSIPIRVVSASRGKRVRAEPVAGMAQRGRWHHVGTFSELEDQLCVWTPESDYSPDRLDAMVWPAWHLKVVSVSMPGVGSFGGSAMARRSVL
jgi:phage terminase large subunit-like protein